MIEWNPWTPGRHGDCRWVETSHILNESVGFGQIWYNAVSDILFIRRASHEFETMTAQFLERKTFKNCFLIGEL